MQRHEEIVVHLHAGSAPFDLRVNVRYGTKQMQRLVDQVRAQVIQQTTRVLRVATLSPRVLGRGAPVVEPRFESQHFAQRAFGEQALHRKEVSVPAAVLIDGERNLQSLCFIDEEPRLVSSGGHRLVDHDGDAGCDRGPRERNMKTVRRRDDHEVVVFCVLPEMVRRLD